MGKKKKKKSSKPKSTSVEKAIINFLSGNHKKEYSFSQLVRKFAKSYNEEKVKRTLESLLDSGKLGKNSRNKIKVNVGSKGGPLTIETVTGTVDPTARGDIYVISPDLNRDVFVARKNSMNAMQGDTVEIKLFGNRKSRPEGVVVKVLKRKQDRFIGTFQDQKNFAFVVPDDRKLPFDLFIPKESYNGAKDGDKVLAQIVRFDDDEKNPVAKVDRVLDDLSRNELEMNNILLRNGFDIEFPEEVLKEAQKFKDQPSEKEIASRYDYRPYITFTIDPDDAKDFDDALSVRILDNGHYEIGIHIADVSHYVKPGSALDTEAVKRTTSVYLPDRVCPMLPERLSNELCSLRPGEDKLAFSVLVEFDDKLNMVSSAFTKSVIHSNRRFTYGEVQHIIDTNEGDYANEIHLLVRIARKMRKKRFQNGSINFESEEVRFELNEEGYPIGIYVRERHESNMLVEDFMLLANVLVAKFVAKPEPGIKPVPMVFRVHDSPDPDRLESFALIARRFGFTLKFENPEQVAATLNDLIKKIHGRPEQPILERMAIRSMAKAQYTTENIGHFGLAFDYYTHFTSPIRRYPDVLVHRILNAVLQDRKDPIYEQDELEKLCRQSSDGERAALESEREAIKYKQVEYLSDKVGMEFNGIITGVIARGFFVELDANKCEGMVRVDNLTDEPYAFDDQALSLTGIRTGLKFQMGDPVRVRVDATNLAERKIDLSLANLVDPEEAQ
jgi:ribonuclease R